MAIEISGVNNNDKITAADGTIDLLSGVNYASTITAPAFTTPGNLTAGHLNIGSGIQLGNAGVATATTFVGNLTGNVNATSNLLLQIGGSEKFRVGSSGQLGIGGANYGTSGQVLTSGGSGSAATWSTITGTTINNNADNRLITGSGSANTLEGEANLTFDGSILSVTGEITPSGHINLASGKKLSMAGDVFKIYHSTVAAIINESGDLIINQNVSNKDIKISTGSGPTERVRITSAGDVQMTGGTVFLNKNSVGIGTTTQSGRNAGVSTATGTIIYNAETEKVQVYANATWRNVGSLEPDQSSGFYDSLSAAQAAGLSHYWPGNSSTALISGLTPDDRKGNPTFNNKESNGYGATNPFFHFAGQTGGDNPTGYRYTHSADWVGHSFSICYWVKIMQEVTEGESTYVQLGNHSGQRSMFAMSSSGNTNLRGKTITIGDDNSNDQIQYEFANWIHVGVRYNYGANSATYYKNGVQTENHTFNGSLSVGTGNNHIYLGYGYWNGSTSNKESCSRMSDIGIWDSTSINGANFGEIYRAGRIVKGY